MSAFVQQQAHTRWTRFRSWWSWNWTFVLIAALLVAFAAFAMWSTRSETKRFDACVSDCLADGEPRWMCKAVCR